MKRTLRILLAIAMLVALFMIPAYAVAGTDDYGAVVVIENDGSGGIKVKVTAETGCGDYNIYFLDPTNEELTNDNDTLFVSVDEFWEQRASNTDQDTFKHNFGKVDAYGVIEPVTVPMTEAGDGINDSGTAPVIGLSANKKYFIIAFADSQGNSACHEVTLDENGLVPVAQCTITWDAAGGSTVEDTKVNQGEAIGTKLPAAPTKAGYKFDGWFTKATGGTQVTATSTAPTADTVTYHAQWTEKKTPSAADFQVTGTYTYNAAAQKPTVSANSSATGMGVITNPDSNKKTDAGTYDVQISVAEGTEYKAGTVTLTDAFTIGKATLNISGGTASVNVGATTNVANKFAVTGLKGTDTAADVYSIAYSSGTPANATVDASGVVTGVKEGSCDITATLTVVDTTNYTAGTATANVAVTVSAAPKANLSIGGNKTVTYGDAAFTQAATTTTSGAASAIRYESSNTAVATVNETTGQVTIVGAGSATITAKLPAGTYGGTYYSAASDQSYTLTVNKKSLTVADGTYAVTKVYDGGTTAGTASGALALTGVVGSDDVTLTGATVGAYPNKTVGTKTVTISGLSLTGTKAANYTVSATYSFTKASITKKDVALTATATKVYDGTDTMALADVGTLNGALAGDTITLTALSGAKFNKADVHTATAAAANGTATYGGADKDNYNITGLTITGSIDQATLDIAVTTTTANVKIGDTKPLSGNFTVTGLKGTDTADVYSIAYSSATPAVATVDSASGVVTGVVEGTSEITATLSTSNANYKVGRATVSATVTVSTADPASMTFDGPATKTYGDPNFNTPASGLSAGVTAADVVYSSSDETVATIDANGKVTILKSGTTTISAKIPAGTYDGNTYAETTKSYDLTVGKKALSLNKRTLSYKVSEGTTGKNLATELTVADPSGLKTLAEAGAILSYAADGGTLNGTQLTWTDKGTINITVTMAENDYYTLANGAVVCTIKSSTPVIIDPPAVDPHHDAHGRYMYGYTDGTIRPKNELTRAEAAALVLRLFDLYDANKTYTNTFTDVSANAWYTNYVGAAQSSGIIVGYPDGKFLPNAKITRAEFTTIVVRILEKKSNVTPGSSYTDIRGSWCEIWVRKGSTLKLIDGYPDGTFRAAQGITREEAVKILNIAAERNPITADIDAYMAAHPELKLPSDIGNKTDWAFYHLFEAFIGCEWTDTMFRGR